jgi:hypothetical protein
MYPVIETHSVHTILKIVFFLLSLVRIKNMFMFNEGRAEQQFHYRTVMINWLFTPNMTYHDLAVKSMELWNRYLNYESVPGFGSKDPSESWGTWCVIRRREGMRGWLHMDVMYCVCMLKKTFHLSFRRDQIKVAIDYLTSPELADKQVQFIVETQLLLKPYLEGREKMHLL